MNERRRELSEYQITSGSEVEGLTPQILFDLHDIALKYGEISLDDQAVRFQSGNIGLGFEINITASAKPET